MLWDSIVVSFISSPQMIFNKGTFVTIFDSDKRILLCYFIINETRVFYPGRF